METLAVTIMLHMVHCGDFSLIPVILILMLIILNLNDFGPNYNDFSLIATTLVLTLKTVVCYFCLSSDADSDPQFPPPLWFPKIRFAQHAHSSFADTLLPSA